MFPDKQGFQSAARTHRGRVRDNNEDSVFAVDRIQRSSFQSYSFGIYIVADGLGGHQAGEVASKTAVRIISSKLLINLKESTTSRSPAQVIWQTIERANAEIFDLAASQPRLRSMGTTVTMGLRLDSRLCVGHVGDSRAYLASRGKIRQLTRDHSLVAQMVREGKITPGEARTHPERGVILRCLGASREVDIDVFELKLETGDHLLLCSDGLTATVSEDEILGCLMADASVRNMCKTLIGLANSRGGEDNVSVVIVRSAV